MIKDKSEVIGKYVTGDMYKGEYIFKEHITSDIHTANDILGSLNGEKKAISITIGSFALGLSGKLETGETGIPVKSSGLVLPSGASARWTAKRVCK